MRYPARAQGSTAVTVVHMIGNAHLDPVWLWGWQAGVDEALATLSAAADRCDEYPDFIFTCGEAWRYRQVERLRPALFARIRRRVAEGRWFIAGGTLVQPDLNLPTAMAVCRQIRHGQSYFQDRFAVRPRIGFNVDSFGHPAFLPDLYAAHGYTAYVLSRPDPRQFDIPSAAFLWRGAGGAELPAFRIVDGYGYVAPDLRDHILHALAGSDPALGHTMCFYGVGDHGGGPTRRQLDWIIENRTAIPGAELRFSTPQAFFAAIADRHALLPRVEGELQHCFPGCYSAMGDIKRAQRRGEELLDQAERTIRAFSPATAQPAHLKAIDTAWEDLLFTAFHDIAAGTATPSAWQSCRAMQGRARIIAETTLLDVTRLWAHQALPPSPDPQIVIINTDDAPFDGLVEHETFLDFDLWQDRILTTADGTPLPFQQVQPDAMQRVPRLIFPVRIPPRTATTVLIRRVPSSPNPAPPSDLQATPLRLANARLAVDLAPSGIAAIALDGHPLLAPAGITLHLRQDHSDTWSNGTDRFTEPLSATLSGAAWQIEESGPLRASVRLEHRLGTSRLRWTLQLHRNDPRLLMRIEINFDERFTALQLAGHLAPPPTSHTDATPGGAIERPLSPVESPAQGWSRVTTPTAELALLTPDAYSLSLDGAQWQWTLLRSPRMAWPSVYPPIYHGRDTHTDQGLHSFAFELHAGPTLPNASLDIATRRMAQPLILFDRTEGTTRPL